MKKETNKKFKDYCKKKNVYLYEVARELGVCEMTLTRQLRTEFSSEDLKRYKSIVDKISEMEDS